MWRYWVGAGAAILVVVAAMFLFRGSANSGVEIAPPPAAAAEAALDAELPEPPAADERTREQKRFDRVDKDRDDTITKDEFFALRKKAFAKLDANGDGRLSFDEWAVRGIARFGGADKDKSGTLNRGEFATTAVKRKAPVKPKCDCSKVVKAAPVAAAPEGAEDGDE